MTDPEFWKLYFETLLEVSDLPCPADWFDGAADSRLPWSDRDVDRDTGLCHHSGDQRKHDLGRLAAFCPHHVIDDRRQHCRQYHHRQAHA